MCWGRGDRSWGEQQVVGTIIIIVSMLKIYWSLEGRKHSCLASSHMQKPWAAGFCNRESLPCYPEILSASYLSTSCIIIPQTSNFLVPPPKCWLPSSHHHIQIPEKRQQEEREAMTRNKSTVSSAQSHSLTPSNYFVQMKLLGKDISSEGIDIRLISIVNDRKTS